MDVRNSICGPVLILFAAMLAALACSSGDDPTLPPGGGGTLTFTSSTPTNGNAFLDAPTVLHEANADGGPYDRVTVTQSVGGISHSLYFYFTASTETVRSAQHVWGPGGAVAQCSAVGTACVPANVTIDTAGQTVTFSNLVLPDDPASSPVTSTVSGTVTW